MSNNNRIEKNYAPKQQPFDIYVYLAQMVYD